MKRLTVRVLFLLFLLAAVSFAEFVEDGSTDTNATTETDGTTETDTTADTNATPTDTTGSTTPADTNTPAADTTGSTTTADTTDSTTPTDTTSSATPADTNTPAADTTGSTTTADTNTAADTTSSTTPSTSTTTTTTSTSASISTPSDVWAGLVLPQVRVNSTFDDPHDIICGGTIRDKVHYITTNQKMNEFKWYIETPSPEGVCLFRISEDIDQNNDTAYVNLIPYGRANTSADGSFPCGREAGADTAFYDIPDDIDCDSCILEWIWRAGNKIVRQCADITVTGGDDTACVGQCQNGGICKRGVCVCPAGYTGTYCENAPGAIGRAARNILAIIFFILLAIIIIILIIMLLFWCAKKKVQDGKKEQIYMEFDVELPSQPQGMARPAEPIKPESQTEY